MRELALLESVYLASLLLLSLVLPLMMSLRGPQGDTVRKSCLKTVWVGQVLCAIAGVVVLASATFAPYAAILGVVGCVSCALRILRHCSTARDN